MLYRSNVLQQLTWSVEIDLNADFKDVIKNRLEFMGVTPSSDENCINEYFNLQKRLIARNPRNIEKSNEFTCPEEYKLALDELEFNIVIGADLIRYMSDSILKPNFNDLLLNDWNIHHFHLTRRFREEDGFAKRSDFEIFIYFTKETAYFIQIYPHKKSNLYSTQEMIKIIEGNWPSLIAKNKINGIAALEEEYDDEKYAKLRDNKISSFVQVNNNFYGMIGGGYASNGLSVEASRSIKYWIRLIKNREIFLIDNIEFILHNIKIINSIFNYNLCIQLLLIVSDNIFIFFEKSNNLIIQIDFKNYVFDLFDPYEYLII